MVIKERFSFAELDYLLERAPRWADLRERLGFPTTEDHSIVSAAGLASLIVRGLVTFRDGQLAPSDSVAGLALALVEPAQHVFMSRVSGDDISTAVVSLAEHPLLVSIVAPGCVELLALNGDNDPEDLVANIAGSLATDGYVVGVGSAGPATLLIGREGEQWLMGAAPDKSMVATDELAVRAGIASVLRRTSHLG